MWRGQIHAGMWCCEVVGSCKVRFPTSLQLGPRKLMSRCPKYQKYWLNPCSIVSIQVHVGNMLVGIVWAYTQISVWMQGKINAAEWCYEDVGSCLH